MGPNAIVREFVNEGEIMLTLKHANLVQVVIKFVPAITENPYCKPYRRFNSQC